MTQRFRHFDDSTAAAASFYRHKESIFTASYLIPIDPTDIHHSLSTPNLPVIQLNHEAMSDIGWSSKSRSIRHQYQGSQECLLITFCISTCMSLFSIFTMIKVVYRKDMRAASVPEWLSVITCHSKANLYFLKILPVYLCGLNCLDDEPGIVLQNIIVMGS